jgi:hypothetical protein
MGKMNGSQRLCSIRRRKVIPNDSDIGKVMCRKAATFVQTWSSSVAVVVVVVVVAKKIDLFERERERERKMIYSILTMTKLYLADTSSSHIII